MSYRTYTTEALVCGSTDVRTADRTFLLFTRELGMVYATAQSVREERSKQRCALQEFSYIRASLIRGKVGWRIASTEALGNIYAREQTREGRAFVRNTLLLIRRLIRGEEAHPSVFDDVISVFHDRGCHTARDAGILISLRILYILGYVAPDETTTVFLTQKSVGGILYTLDDSSRQWCESCITHALTESHL
jgi:recombinational DNA repair protein (RecF pathway)